MVVGFVNSGLMTLRQAVWIIMGANIGTTITAQLVALDIGMMAPLLAFIGVAMIVFLKSPKIHHIGKILAGFGVLFIGMDMMSVAMEPLRELPAFVSLMTTFSNPFIGILVGAVFTAIIQSSSASVGILQTLAASGLIGFSSAVFVLFGMNIGTCITAVLASIGTNRSAKRTTIIHLMFNLIGTTVFTALCVVLPITDWVGSLTPGDPAGQLANMHTIFNVVTTCLLLPFGAYMAAFAEKILPDVQEEHGVKSSVSALSEEFRRGTTTLGANAVHMDMLSQDIRRMITLAGENVQRSFDVVLKRDESLLETVSKTEKNIDMFNKDLSRYVSKILVNNNNDDTVFDIEQYFLITGNAERIGDHAVNIAGYITVLEERAITFSESAMTELEEMKSVTKKAIEKVLSKHDDLPKWLSEISAMEQQIDDMTKSYRDHHLSRMRKGKCSEEACVLYSELLTDFERIGDHILNIAQAYAKIHMNV